LRRPFFEPLGVGHPGSERLSSAVVDGVAYDRSAAPRIPRERSSSAGLHRAGTRHGLEDLSGDSVYFTDDEG
jgi:hypothetical protein